MRVSKFMEGEWHMGSWLEQSRLDQWMSKMGENKRIFSTVLCVEDQDRNLALVSSAGGMQPHDRYFITSVTKLYVTAIILQLRAEGLIDLDDPIRQHLSDDIMQALHILDHHDYSGLITVKHLMSNTSGIPDYFSGQVFADLVAGHDQPFGLTRVLSAAKAAKPKFFPGQKGKAQYSDTNYQLLGRILENITGQPVASLFKERIFDPLNLNDTYFYLDPQDDSPIDFYYKEKRLRLPIYMSSIGTEGGIVSTAKENMTFLRAFFDGSLFPKSELKELTMKWNFLWSPGTFYYGTGISRQPISPFALRQGLIGHWGQSGAFAFHHRNGFVFHRNR
ncbi:D-alanyl-D-alanine carboxypeptidase [Paenibacillus sp. JCM 10914]|nr:D-alanyl-D-alanine carboxypeptidase [Paenibacillus sp. JCM 10914]